MMLKANGALNFLPYTPPLSHPCPQSYKEQKDKTGPVWVLAPEEVGENIREGYRGVNMV
jgi:hypothetical protein